MSTTNIIHKLRQTLADARQELADVESLKTFLNWKVNYLAELMGEASKEELDAAPPQEENGDDAPPAPRATVKAANPAPRKRGRPSNADRERMRQIAQAPTPPSSNGDKFESRPRYAGCDDAPINPNVVGRATVPT